MSAESTKPSSPAGAGRPAPVTLIGECHSGGAYHWTEFRISEIIPRAEGGARVLLLGCGDAGERSFLQELGYLPIGLDIRRDAGGDCVADAHDLPLRSSSVDVVLSMQVLEHLRAPWEAAREISRVLRPGGCFVGSVAFLKPYHGSYFHMTHEGVRELLRPVGLELEVVDGAQSLSFATYGSLSGLPASSLLRLGMRALDRLIMRVRAMIWSATRRQSSHEPTDRFDPDLAMSFRVFDRVRFAPAIVFRARKTCDAADERQRAAMGSEMLSERIPEVEI